MKVCRTCKENKPLIEFNKNKRQIDGYAKVCRTCDKAYNKANYRLRHPVETIQEGHKKCSGCQQIKPNTEYNRRGSDKLQPECKTCASMRYQTWRQQGGKEWENEYSKYRKATDPKYKLRFILRLRLLDALKRQLRGGKVGKTHSALDLIGCTMEELQIHLQSKFIGDMAWNNHGTVWEIDHIVPCTWFNLEDVEEQRKCFHYTNLQPLFSTTRDIEGVTYLGNRNKRNFSDYLLP